MNDIVHYKRLTEDEVDDALSSIIRLMARTDRPEQSDPKHKCASRWYGQAIKRKSSARRFKYGYLPMTKEVDRNHLMQMKRYYFHRRLYGATYLDREGICFANAQAARNEALPAAIEMLQETIRAPLPLPSESCPIDWRMWVVDEDGTTLSILRFQVEEFGKNEV